MILRAFIVTGSRDWDDSAAIRKALAPLEALHAFMIVGGAKGADLRAEALWASCFQRYVVMPAAWPIHGNSAGPKRNAEMLKVLLALKACGYAVSVEAFSLPQSSVGTKHMKAIAAKAGVHVNEHGRILDVAIFGSRNSCRRRRLLGFVRQREGVDGSR